jgi:hypothetical protein
MTPIETKRTPEEVAAGLTEAQRRWLREICRTSGGGVHVACRITDDGEAVPSQGPVRKLYDKDLIQGKSGAYSTVVHTRLGWAINRAIIEQEQAR